MMRILIADAREIEREGMRVMVVETALAKVKNERLTFF
jgi:hypothetical protein